jgi:cytochrome c oxidase cbb3-type subunit 3
MAKHPQDALLDHEYDGIREYDNPTPAWWHAIFLGSVVFSVLYFVFFHIGPSAGTNGWTLEEAHEEALADNLKLQFKDLGDLQVDEPTVLKYMNEPDWLAVGASVYKTHCKSCHGGDGSGLVGPNLTDDHYKNVKQLIDLARVIENGAANGSMPAWKNRLHTNEVVMVSAYVAKMRGQNLPGPRGTEGPAIPAWPAALPAKEQPK